MTVNIHWCLNTNGGGLWKKTYETQEQGTHDSENKKEIMLVRSIQLNVALVYKR